jgi:hypothetical protein
MGSRSTDFGWGRLDAFSSDAGYVLEFLVFGMRSTRRHRCGNRNRGRNMVVCSSEGLAGRPLTIGSSNRGARLRRAKERIDDWDKVPSFDAGEAPRRSISSLDETMTSASDLAWEVVATLPDVASAHVLATMIRGEGVPAMVVTDSSLLGEARRSEVRVPTGMARRAHWLMSQAQFTDAELTFLATGELGGDDSAEQ